MSQVTAGVLMMLTGSVMAAGYEQVKFGFFNPMAQNRKNGQTIQYATN